MIIKSRVRESGRAAGDIRPSAPPATCLAPMRRTDEKIEAVDAVGYFSGATRTRRHWRATLRIL